MVPPSNGTTLQHKSPYPQEDIATVHGSVKYKQHSHPNLNNNPAINKALSTPNTIDQGPSRNGNASCNGIIAGKPPVRTPITSHSSIATNAAQVIIL